MLSQHFCFFLSPKSCFFLLCYCTPFIRSIIMIIFQESALCTMTQQWNAIHKSYAIFSAIAICVLVIFIFCPTILLILYPTRMFRKCVSCCGFCRWHALHMFVESFQRQYKDGTSGTRDFRMVSASFLVLRILILAFFLNHHRLLSHTSIIQGAFIAGA